MDTENTPPLVAIALDGIARLDGDDAKEEALRTLGNVLAGQSIEDGLTEKAFVRLLSLSVSLEAPWTRGRAFADACTSLRCSRLQRERRVELLESAIELADGAENEAERIDRMRAAVEALAEIRRDDDVTERLEKLGEDAVALEDVRGRLRASSQVALTLAKLGEGARAVKLLDRLAPSAGRGKALALLAQELIELGEIEEGAALLEATIGEIRNEPESYEQALALRAVLSTLLETGVELPGGDGIETALDVVDALHDARFKKDALFGAIEAFASAPADPTRSMFIAERLRASIGYVEETYTRAPLLGELAFALACRGDVRGAESALTDVAILARQADSAEVADALGDPVAALPVAKILAALADDENPLAVYDFAMRALEIVRPIHEPATISSLVRQSAQFFASPALPYDARLALLDRALWVATAIWAQDPCVEAVAAVANAYSLAGATERGDGLFAGLVVGIDPRFARKAHLERAITLVRLGRTADAREQLVAAAELPGGGEAYAIEELAQACARCGFIGDVINVLERVEPARQVEARKLVADALADSTYIDPALRIIGLESIASDADTEVVDTVVVLIAEVRLLEKLGDALDVVARGFARTAAIESRGRAAGLEQQLVGALIERLRRDGA